MSTTNMK